jgi:RNA polymerase sigma-70 factor, ECF subfamily
VLVRLTLGRRLQGKVDASDLVQETFLRAHQHFAQFRGATDKEFLSWLRQILAAHLAEVVRRYYGARCRDVRLEQELVLDVEQSSCALARGLAVPQSSPSQQAARRELAVVVSNALAELPAT